MRTETKPRRAAKTGGRGSNAGRSQFNKPGPCPQCLRLITRLPTRHEGAVLTFDADPLPVVLALGEGWVPIRRRIDGGGGRWVYVPLDRESAERQLRIQHVMMIHQCGLRRGGVA